MARQVGPGEGLRTLFSLAVSQTSTCRITGPSCSGLGGRPTCPTGASRLPPSTTVLEGSAFCTFGDGDSNRYATSVRRAYGDVICRLPFQIAEQGSVEVAIDRHSGLSTTVMVVSISPLSSASHAPSTT